MSSIVALGAAMVALFGAFGEGAATDETRVGLAQGHDAATQTENQANMAHSKFAGVVGFIEACGRSHEHVCRTSHEVLGVTPTAYINQIRIEHAAHLLRSDDIQIERVAETCGFENTSYFYRLFRRQYGATPRAYRLRHQKSPF